MGADNLVERLISDERAEKYTLFRVPNSGGLCLAIDQRMLASSVGAWRGMAMPESERRMLVNRIIDAIAANTEAFRTMSLSPDQNEDFVDKCALWFAHELLYADVGAVLIDDDASRVAYVTH